MARERAAGELERFLAERAGPLMRTAFGALPGMAEGRAVGGGPACGGEGDRKHWFDDRSRQSWVAAALRVRQLTSHVPVIAARLL
jgi:hypothetical protein